MAQWSSVGFKDARTLLCAALKSGAYTHEPRADHATKNLLQSGAVTPTEVDVVIRAANGNDYEESEHHQLPGTAVHLITREWQGTPWYIKWYVVAPNHVFISVHH